MNLTETLKELEIAYNAVAADIENSKRKLKDLHTKIKKTKKLIENANKIFE